MRKLLLSLLLASAAASPALAQSNDPDRRARADRADREDRADRQQARAERQQQREERQQAREQRAASIDRAQVNVERREDRAVIRDQRERLMRRQQVAVDGNARAQFDEQRRAQREIRRERLGDAAEPDVLQQRAGGGFREQRRPLPNVLRSRIPVVSNEPREGTQPPLRAERHRPDSVRWNSNWRHDRRHDWRSWRNRHRSTFRVGIYYDPFGWNYRPYSIGWRMWPSYYSSRYQINDPWQYRLPYAPPGYRWIRYWDDAILVDTWSGQVVDVIHNFFW